MPPNVVAIDYDAAAGGDRRRRRARRRRAADRRRGAGQCLHRLATGRRRRRRCGVRARRACRVAARSTTTASSPTRWSRAARSAPTIRRAAATRCMSPARTSTATATTPPARSASTPADVRFIAPDVGGGFGAKNFIYAEHALILWAAQARRPAGEMDRHAAARSSSPTTRRATIRPRRRWRSMPTGRFLALRVASVANLGAYLAGGAGGGADLPVRPSAGHGLPHPGDRAACRGGADQHHADRRDARPRLCRDGQHHRAADRRGGAADAASTAPNCAAATWCRPRRCR